jgi:hypothetical protein
MGPRLKTFSLDDETVRIVQQRRNQSQWIRTLILQEENYERAQLERVNKINRAALNYACGLLRDMHEEGHDIVRYLEMANEQGVEAWEKYKHDNDAGYGVDWIRERITRYARDEM